MTSGASSERHRAVPRPPQTDPALVAARAALPADAWLVRSGESKPMDMAISAWTCRNSNGRDPAGSYGLSFMSFAGMSPEEIAERVKADCLRAGRPNIMMQPVLRRVAAQELLDAHQAFYLRRTTNRPGHYTLYLPIVEGSEPWSDAESLLASEYGTVFDDIDRLLGEAVPNPASTPRGGRK